MMRTTVGRTRDAPAAATDGPGGQSDGETSSCLGQLPGSRRRRERFPLSSRIRVCAPDHHRTREGSTGQGACRAWLGGRQGLAAVAGIGGHRSLDALPCRADVAADEHLGEFAVTGLDGVQDVAVFLERTQRAVLQVA